METTLSAAAIDRFRSSLFAKGRSDQTIKAYSSDLLTLLRDLNFQTLPMKSFEQSAQQWLNQYRRIVAPKTTVRRLTSLRMWVKWAGWTPMLNDYTAPTPPRGTPHPLSEGVQGIRRMISVARSDEQKALVALCGLVGLRVSESLSITPIDFGQNYADLTVRGKGDKTRVVPVSNEALDVCMPALGRAWLSSTATPLIGFKDRFARSTITDLAVRAGLSRRVASHDLRATFATEVYNRTRDQRVVQMLLGHASGVTTEIYIGVAEGKLRSAVELV